MSIGVGDAFVVKGRYAEAEHGLSRHSIPGGFPRQIGPETATDAISIDTEAAEVELGLGAESGFASWLRARGLAVEFAVCLGGGTMAAMVTDTKPTVGVLALGVWAIGNYHRGNAVTSPLTRQLESVAGSALLPMAMASAAIGFLGASPALVPQVFAAVLMAALLSACCRVIRWRLQAPVRVLLVGDRVAIAQAASMWGPSRRVRVVSGVVTEPDLDADAVPKEVLGVPTMAGIDNVPSFAAAAKADLVVVHPGPGFTAVDMQRLTWSLEDAKVSIGVLGVLDAVAPHRIRPGGLGCATVMDVRVPRPSVWVRSVKVVADRLAGALLLVVAAPVILAMSIAVRLDSRGPALFVQTRVGLGGRSFKVYKMRTMVHDADELKAALAEANEFDSVLFKMKRDPRITRIGAVLRKSSLDELPQLINVVKGEMSLVGPRPFLPAEIEKMDSDALRRLAVRPGITGLWQVSGRSDLGWEESAALDRYYADNWSLVGDVVVGMRTVKAVVGGKGAY